MTQQYFGIFDGRQLGPFKKEELRAQSGFSSATPVWTEGMQDWMAAGDVIDLQTESNAVPPPYTGTVNASTPDVGVTSNRWPSVGTSNDFLFFDPSRPRMLGLVLLWTSVLSPLLFLLASCSDLSHMSAAAAPDEHAMNVMTVLRLPLALITTAVLLLGGLLLRGRHQWGLLVTAVGFALESIGGLFFALVCFGIGAVASAEPYADAVVQEQPTSAAEIFIGALQLGGWLFSWFCLAWLVYSWRSLKSDRGDSRCA